MPQILAGIDVAILAEWRAVQQGLCPDCPLLVAIGREYMGRLRAELEQKAG